MRPSPALLVACLALGVAAAGTAWATIPGADGTIQGCYDPSGGKPPYPLSVVDNTGDCHPPSVLLPFNQTGPPGSPGAAGISGPAGAPGASGIGGSAYTAGFDAHVDGTFRLLTASRSSSIAHLALPAGSYVVDGELELGLSNSVVPAEVVCWLRTDVATGPDGSDTTYFDLASDGELSGRGDLHGAFNASAPTTVTLGCAIGQPRPHVGVAMAVQRMIATSQSQVTDEPQTVTVSHTAPPASVIQHLHPPKIAPKPSHGSSH